MIRLLTIMIVLCAHTVFNTVKAAGSELIEQVEREKNQAHWSGLPIWGEQVREMGYELPIPVGFGVYMNSQDVEYIATDDFKIDATGGVLGGFGKPAHYVVPADDVAIKGTDKSVQLRADAWVFPFLNIYGLAGYTEGNKEISADLSNATRNGKPFGVPATIPINIEYQAYNLGIGAVIATQIDVIEGINPIIITAAGAVTNAWTTTTDSTILTKIGSLRVGQRYDVPYGKLALLLGYQYQSIEQNVTGSLTNLQVGGINLADELQFDVDLKSKETSNMSLAAVYDFGYEKEWNLMAEYSFLNWNQLIVAVGYRF
ncbi:hypothetical protein MD535_11090 [Vibrio sp. ZSDZ65]|uniref:Outer membrane protein beta-barrel domain-containing protein n=1 Tax=Vibrio qingdaonensis TaxID=2829491 RepID=A0A9X3CN80_9VIBR|nr:hypothetical protein [Vibrio qingdaonensis]MCW8346547.1 hypothetical protein [Vibrio qingdaonensis]